MKITIVQREIEEAIREYIKSQISVKEGHDINMEFTNTRGDDGLIAAIDISPSTKKPGPSGRSSARVTETAAPAPTRAPRRASAVEETTDEQSVPDNEPAEVEAEVQARVSEEPDEDEDAVAGSAPLRKSIFSGLSRPSDEAAA